jgi:hypothetical protein
MRQILTLSLFIKNRVMQVDVSKTFFFFGEALLNLVFIIIAFFSVFNVIHLIASVKRKTRFRLQFFNGITVLMISAFSFLGFAIGLLVGFSVSPVVHVVIPALLTFYGGFLTYIFSKDSPNDSRKYISILLSAIAVSIFLIYGVEVGSKERNEAAKSQKEFDLYYMEKEEAIKQKYR